MLVTIGAAFMSSLDLFVVNVAFADLGTDFRVGTQSGPTSGDLSWVLNAYAVVFAALLVPLGRLADRYGSRSIFLGGLLLFVLSSAACALSRDVTQIVACRVLQAVGAAAMTPTSLSLLIAALPEERRLGGVRLWAATGAVAAAIGPTVGGVLTQASWRWVFLINLPVGAALLFFAVSRLTQVASDRSAPRPDLAGASMFAGSTGLLALGMTKGPDWGWTNSATVASFGGAAVLGALFLWQSRRHPAPVISPGLLRVRTFRWANFAMVTFNVSFAASLLVGVLWLQQIWGYSAMTTGYAIAVGPLMVPLTAALTHRLLPNVTAARLVAAGSLICAAGTCWTATHLGTEPAYATAYLPGWIIGGIGVGLALPNLMAGATQDLVRDETATGIGIAAMSRQIGFVIGVSVLFAIVGSNQGVEAQAGFRTTLWVCAGVLVLSALGAVGMASRTHSEVAA